MLRSEQECKRVDVKQYRYGCSSEVDTTGSPLSVSTPPTAGCFPQLEQAAHLQLQLVLIHL